MNHHANCTCEDQAQHTPVRFFLHAGQSPKDLSLKKDLFLASLPEGQQGRADFLMRLGVEELVRTVLDLERSQASRSSLLEERLRAIEAENSELRGERIQCNVEVKGATARLRQNQREVDTLTSRVYGSP